MGISEREVIDLVQRIFPTSHPDLQVGIGDDAAIFSGRTNQVVTTDIAVEGVHFKREWSPARSIGARSVAANIADLQAMNAIPQFLLLTVTLTGSETFDWIEDLLRGIAAEVAKSGVAVIGGDTSRGAVFSISVTAIGYSEKPILRSGAKVGDSIYLSGLTGWSAAGLHLLKENIAINSATAEKAISRYQTPEISYGIDFSSATSMADVSDAVIIQAEQMAASSQVRFEIDLDLFKVAIDFADLSSLADSIGRNVFDWIIGGGEDHVLLATGKDLPGLKIGEVRPGVGISFTQVGREIKMAPDTWDHFR